MKILFLTLTLFFVVKLSIAQDHKYAADSLKQKLRYAKQDTSKVNLLIDIGDHFTWVYPDSALKYDAQAWQLAQRLNFKTGEIRVLQVRGEALVIRGDHAKSIAMELKALQLSESLGNKDLIYRSLYEIGFGYYQSGDAQKSLDYFFKLKAHIPASKWFKSEYFDCWVGSDFFDLNKLDSAQYYADQGYSLDSKNKALWYPIHRLKSDLCVKNGQFKQAINYIYPYCSSRVDRVGVDYLAGCTKLASIYQKRGMKDSAIFYAKKVIQVKKQASMMWAVLEASQTLTEMYTTKHDIDSAFKYQGMMLAAKDSLFSQEKVKALQEVTNKEAERQQDLVAAKEEIINRTKMYALIGVLVVFLLIGIIIWRNYRQQKKSNIKIQKTLAELKSTQTQLIQSEKMASLGELTAGIAHEIQNPLNFVNNFSEVNKEMLEELKAESQKPKAERDEQLEIEIIDGLIKNEQKIIHHGKRADGIVKGMLEHSRSHSGQKELTDLNAMADEYMRLSYHGLRAKDKSFNAEMVTHFDEKLPKVNVIPQDIGRVMLNLFNNAFYAVNQRLKTASADYKPEVSVTTYSENNHIVIKVKDNGVGIPDTIKEKIMQPFFTTKPTGEGTGLGLSLTYDMVVKGHGGSIEVNTKEGEGAEFIISLAIN